MAHAHDHSLPVRRHDADQGSKWYSMKRIKISLVSRRLGEVEITMPCGSVVLMDRSDLPTFSNHAWYIYRGIGQTNYLVANCVGENGGRIISFHQYLMDPPNGLEVDHINRNGLDNRRNNLRVVTHEINQQNLPKRRGAASKYRGVYASSNSKGGRNWQVGVYYKGFRKNLGHFMTEQDAANAYNNFVIKNGFDLELNKI